MKLSFYPARLLLAFFLSFITIAPVASQDIRPLVRPEWPTLEVGAGQIESLRLVLENAHDVYGIDVRATFDPAVIEIVDADPDSEGVQMMPGHFPQPDFLVRNTGDNAAGTLQYVATQVNPTPPANGKGLIFSVHLRGKTLDRQSVFTVEFVDIVDREGRKLSVRSQSASIQVVPPGRPASLPPAGAIPGPFPALAPVAVDEPAPVLSPARLSAAGMGNSNSLGLMTLWIALAGGGCLGAPALLAIARRVLAGQPSRPARRKL